MREAIVQYVEREEKREAFKQEDIRAWEEYQQTGLHVTLEEADAWLAKLEAGENAEPPSGHSGAPSNMAFPIILTFYADLVEEASALWESLAQNHPFIDGNKRAAFAVTYTFLAINNLRITADAGAIYAFISGLYEARSFEFDHLVHWLRANTAAV